MSTKKFSLLSFLSAIGAGGIAVAPFAFFNYVIPHSKGLVTLQQILNSDYNGFLKPIFPILFSIMGVFSILHFILLITLIIRLISNYRQNKLIENFSDPLKNTAFLSPLITLAMSMNVLIGPIRFFLPILSDNLQVLMLPALIFWLILVLIFMSTEMKILHSYFAKSFDLKQLGFSWLFDVFTASMIAVTGTGIAALAKNANIAHLAAFFSISLVSLAIFLLAIKIVSVFQSHFQANDLPEKEMLPSFLNIVPAITLLSISLFRFGHYLENQFHFHLEGYFLIIILAGFAFETWYLWFGIQTIFHYFTKQHFQSDFFISQWALICPFVAYAVLGSFLYSVFIPSNILLGVILLALSIAIFLFFNLLIRFIKYCKA